MTEFFVTWQCSVTLVAAAPVSKWIHPLHGLTPYWIPFNAVALWIICANVTPTHVLGAVNASCAGHARSWMTSEDMQIGRPACPDSNLQCLGFGICREIDMDKRFYHIHMPVPWKS